jgi:hypothetical protein
MALSISHSYPLGFANPVTVRAAAALPVGGTFDAAPTEIACAGAWWVRLYFTYTRAAAGGALSYRYEVSPYAADVAGVEDWFQGTLYAAGALNPCSDAVSFVQAEEIRYCSTSADAETFVSPPIHLAGCSERFRLACRESGTPIQPGDAHVMAVFYVEG